MSSQIVSTIKEYVSGIIGDLINKGYYFHNLEHTLDVFNRATYLASREGVSTQDLELLQIASLFHDTGFLHCYDDNEKIGAEMCGKYLQQMNFPEEKIYTIKQIILATIPFRKPSNLLEQIIKDADLDNLGRDDCSHRSDCLRKELFEIKGKSFTEKDWSLNIYNFIDKQYFHVPTQIAERGSTLVSNKKMLKDKLMNLI